MSYTVGLAAPIPKVDGKTVKVIFKVISGVAAVFAASKTAEAKAAYEEKAAIIADLRNKGIDTKDGALYQLFFRVDPGASDRWFFYPNVFALIQIEGQDGDFIPASCARSYRGQPWGVSFYAKEIKPGAKVIVHLLDDKSLSNQIWENLLKTKYSFQVENTIGVNLIRATITSTKDIQLLDDAYSINSYGYLATAEFVTPKSSDGSWLADGRFVGRSGKEVGEFQVMQTWRVDSSLSKLNSSWIVFWGGLTIVFGLVFLKYLYSQNAKKIPEPETVNK